MSSFPGFVSVALERLESCLHATPGLTGYCLITVSETMPAVLCICVAICGGTVCSCRPLACESVGFPRGFRLPGAQNNGQVCNPAKGPLVDDLQASAAVSAGWGCGKGGGNLSAARGHHHRCMQDPTRITSTAAAAAPPPAVVSQFLRPFNTLQPTVSFSALGGSAAAVRCHAQTQGEVRCPSN